MARIFALLSVLFVGFPAVYAQDITNNFNPNIGTPCFSVLGAGVTHRTDPIAGYIYEGPGSLSMESCCGGSETPAYFISPNLPAGTHTVSFWVKASTVTCGPILSIGTVEDVAGTNFVFVDSVRNWPNPVDWKFVSFTVTTTNIADYIAIQEPTGNSCTVFVDLLIVTNVGSPSNDCSAFLPIELSHFSATQRQQTVVVTWETLSEAQVVNFEVERSADGIRFAPIAALLGHNDAKSSHRYSIVDHNPLPGVNYYRLKTNFLSESPTYSKVEVLHFQGKGSNDLRLCPTVAHDFTVLCQRPVSNTFDQTWTLRLMDASGRLLRQQTVSAEEASPRLDLSDLPAGFYTVSLTDGVRHWTSRVVKPAE